MKARDKVKGFFRRFKQHDNAKTPLEAPEKLPGEPDNNDSSEPSASTKGQSCNDGVPSDPGVESDQQILGSQPPDSVDSDHALQTQPAAEKSMEIKTSIFPPISELWDEAYDELEQDESKSELINNYHEVLEATLGEGELSLKRGQRREQMEKVVLLKRNQVEAGKKKLRVAAVIDTVVTIIGWSKDYVATALAPSPPASIAWAGLLLNPSQQETSRLVGLTDIASIICECSMREELYRMRYEADNGKELQSALDASHANFRDTMRTLYTHILEFQATYVCYLSGKMLHRLANDMTKWSDWDGLMEKIRVSNAKLDSLDKHWAYLNKEECWKHWKKRLDQDSCNLEAIQDGVQKIQSSLFNAQTDKDRSQLLQWLRSVGESVSALDGYKTHSRKRGNLETGNWLLVDPAFRKWKREPNQFLWLHGKAGTGKSVLSTKVVDYLQASHNQYPESAVAYFYVNFQDPETHRKDNIVASLMVQLLSQRPGTPQFLLDLYYKYGLSGLQDSQLENGLRSASQEFDRTYLVIDGIDECRASALDLEGHGLDLDAQQELLDFIKRVHGWKLSGIHLLVTSRPEQGIKEALNDLLQSSNTIDLAAPALSGQINQDMTAFLDDRLQRKNFNNQRKVHVMDSIISKADGMFLYAALQVGQFSTLDTDGSIKRKLNQLPPGIDGAYKKVLLTLSEHKLAIRALTWVSFTPSPLTLAQLAEAVLIDLESPNGKTSASDDDVSGKQLCVPLIDHDDRLDIPQILNIAPGLLEHRDRTFDEWGLETLQAPDLLKPDSVVVLRHFSVLEYLKSARIREVREGSVAKFALHEETARTKLAEACLRYHSYVAQRIAQGNAARADFPLIRQAYVFGLRHAEMIGRQKWQDTLRDLIRYTFQKGGKAFDLLKQLDSPLRETGANSPLQYTVSVGLWETMIFLIEENLELDVNSVDTEFGRTPLSWASGKGRADIVELLLQKGSKADSKSKFDRTPLSYAAENGHDAVVRMLIDKGVEADSQSTGGQTPLCWAAARGNIGIVNLLLSKGANPDSGDEYGQTPLAWAAANGHEDVADLLIKTKRVNINSKDNEDGQTPLSWAAANGHEGLVKLLLKEVDIDVQTSDSADRTPLSLAAANGSAKIVDLLLQFLKEDKHRVRKKDAMALSWAAANGHDPVVERLLEDDITVVNTKDPQYGRTPLAWAAANGHTSVVQRLLDVSETIDVNLKDTNGQTARSLADANRHAAIVELLQRTARIEGGFASEGSGPIVLLDDKQGMSQTSEIKHHQITLRPPEIRLAIPLDSEILVDEEQHRRLTSPDQTSNDSLSFPAIAEDDDRQLGDLLHVFSIKGGGRESTYFWPMKLLCHILSRAQILTQLRTYTDLPNAEDYVDYIRPEEAKLDRPKTPSYLKIFALLLLLRRGKEIGNFVNEKLSDQCLPIQILSRFDIESGCREDFSYEIDNPRAPFTKWRERDLEKFGEMQWKFLTPYLDLDQHQRPRVFHFDDRTVLPWPEPKPNRQPYADNMVRIHIHPASHGFQEVIQPICLVDEMFSLMEIRSERVEKAFNTRFHNDRRPDHLIPLLATFNFQRQRNRYCLFPFPKCDLENYWEAIEPKPEMTTTTVRWVYRQCSGIIAALDAIHNPGHNFSSLEVMPRERKHGAIMASNILLFKSSHDLKGILVLSNMTPSNSWRETSRSAIPNSRILRTSSYQPPEEYLEDGLVFWASDIWAVGCLVLEMFTWLLGGWELLVKFKQQRFVQSDFLEFQRRHYLPLISDDTFFEVRRDENRAAPLVRVKQQVTEWFDELRNHENCSQLIRDTLDVIKTEMIVVSPEARSESAALSNTFRVFSNRIDISDDLDKA